MLTSTLFYPKNIIQAIVPDSLLAKHYQLKQSYSRAIEVCEKLAMQSVDTQHQINPHNRQLLIQFNHKMTEFNNTLHSYHLEKFAKKLAKEIEALFYTTLIFDYRDRASKTLSPQAKLHTIFQSLKEFDNILRLAFDECNTKTIGAESTVSLPELPLPSLVMNAYDKTKIEVKELANNKTDSSTNLNQFIQVLEKYNDYLKSWSLEKYIQNIKENDELFVCDFSFNTPHSQIQVDQVKIKALIKLLESFPDTLAQAQAEYKNELRGNMSLETTNSQKLAHFP